MNGADVAKFPEENFRDGVVPSMDLQEWVEKVFGIPQRTFQWWVQQGLLPRPSVKRGRFRYYVASDIQSKIVSCFETQWTVKGIANERRDQES